MVSTSTFPIRFRVTRLCITVALFAYCMLVNADIQVNSTLSEADLKAARDLDWVPIEELTDEQKKRVPTACCGAYIAPLRADADASLAPDIASLRATAAETQTEQQTHVSMTGKVAITQGNRSITTDSAFVDQDTRQAELNGNIQLREPGLLFRANKAKINMDNGEAQLDNTTFVLYETRIHGNAEHLQKFSDNVISLEHSEISSCEPGDNAWSIQGSEIKIYAEEHYGTAENMRVRIKDVPVIYVPYARFPVGNERLSGFLFPTISSNSSSGVDMATPIYLNLAPNYDAIITPRYMSDRGAVFEAETRHMAELFDTELSGSLINNDRGGYSSRLEGEIQQGLDPQVAYPYRGKDRWFYNFNQRGGHDQAWTTFINYTDMSDKDFQRDMNNGSVDANRQAYVYQEASLDYRTDHWFVGAKADEYRLLTANQLPYRELPRVHVDGNYRFGDWVFTLDNEYVDFVKNRDFSDTAIKASNTTADKDESILVEAILGQRLNTDYRVVWDKSNVWGFFKPSLAIKSLSYQLSHSAFLANIDSTPAFVIPQASLDTGLYFERTTSLFGGDYINTFEPRAFYFYSEYQNQNSLYDLTSNQKSSYVNFNTSELTFNYNQLFRTSRFTPGDRIDDANQLSLALSSAFISQTTGIERFRVSMGEIFYAKDRRITIYDGRNLDASKKEDKYLIDANTRSSSALALQLSGQVGDSVRLSADAAYNQQSAKMDNINTGIHYMDEQYRLFNIAYRYTLRPVISSPSQPIPVAEESLNQVDASVLWPINSRWSAVARTNYDFHYGVELDTFAGFEYNDCCYRARFMWRRWLNFDYTQDFLKNVKASNYEKSPYPFIEIELKGLGSMSKKISSLLEKAVAGFDEREKHLH